MPGSYAGHLPQALMSFPGKLLGMKCPVIHLTFHAMALGHRHGLLQSLSGPVHLLCNRATIQLYLHDVGLLLPQGKQAHLHKETQRYLAVFLHQDEVLFQLLFSCVVLPLLAVFSEGLLLILQVYVHKYTNNIPVFIESTLALIANVLSKDGLEIAQTLQCADVAHHSHHDQRRSLNDSDCLHLLSLHMSPIVAMHLPQCVGHASFVAQKRCEVDGLFGVIFGPIAHLPTMPLTPLMGQEAQVAVTRGVEFTVRLEGQHTSTYH
uniref:Uncharacterized protein n=1 Tax=Pygocentrus nattereri TaxID=42514 RepID=A0A3B4EIK9_PYGNA